MIYLDYNATTPIDKRVADAVQPYLYEVFGNPSSNHEAGKLAKEAVEKAREKVAMLLNSSPEEILFTSGGSESNNTVIKGVAYTYRDKGNHIITSQIEHPAVLAPCRFLENNGYEVTYLPADEYGMISAEDVEKAITDKTILITIMHSNNETGTIQPIEEIGSISKKHGVLFHTDASQSLGKVQVDVNRLQVDFLTVAGHKLYAPKGVGALYMRSGINIEPLIHGAGHECGRRAGTENIVLNAALGEACEIAREAFNSSKTEELTQYFYKRLLEIFGDKIKLNGHPTLKLPNTLNISFIGYNGYEVIEKLGDVALSTGSACHSGSVSISPVLAAMGVPFEIARGAVRFSFGRFTTKEELDIVLDRLKHI
ncbi:MAG: cysteine desulfurase NifS [Clostridiales bacterium]|jgi:cysteine desulfurase|nr:cysteine desulfurase NifS [Clostridiales bacterium]